MFFPNINNLNDLKITIDHLNLMDAWGSWGVALVTEDSIQKLIQQNLDLILSSQNDVHLRQSLADLSKRVKEEPYFGPEAKGLAQKIKRLSEKEIEIHFIWIGSDLPPKYLNNIKECAAKALSDKDRGYRFSVNLWVENDNHYWNTAIKEDNIIHGKRFKIRHLSELNNTIGEKYSKKTATKICSYTRRELAGLKNFAAASDILRCIALQKDGGFYFDTDLGFSVLTDNNKVHDPYYYTAKNPNSRKKFWEKEKLWENRGQSTFFNVKGPVELTMAGQSINKKADTNCVILAEKETPHLKEVVETIIRQYDELNDPSNVDGFLAKVQKDNSRKIYTEKNYCRKPATLQVKLSPKSTSLFHWPITTMDAKRSHLLCLGYAGNRNRLTIRTSLCPLTEKVQSIADDSKEQILILYKFSPDFSHKDPCINQPILIHCDKTWLNNPSIRFVDTNDIGADPFKITSVIERQRKFPRI